MSLERRLSALESRSLSDPFAHLDDEELDTFCDVLREFLDGGAGEALNRWDALNENLRAKFARTIQLAEILH